jgi:nucleoside-diphosphate-sugar epimerase
VRRRALVTGGAGFVGSNLVSNLLADKFEVTVFDAFLRLGNQDNVAWLLQHPDSSHLSIVKSDIRDFRAARKLYLPLGGRHFWSRRAYELAYASQPIFYTSIY